MAKEIAPNQRTANHCEQCHHPRILHDPTEGCLVCLLMAREKGKGRVCTIKMEFKIPRHVREQAVAASKESYPERTMCAVCYDVWMAHRGYLCPSGDSLFLPLLDKDLPYLHGELN